MDVGHVGLLLRDPGPDPDAFNPALIPVSGVVGSSGCWR